MVVTKYLIYVSREYFVVIYSYTSELKVIATQRLDLALQKQLFAEGEIATFDKPILIATQTSQNY